MSSNLNCFIESIQNAVFLQSNTFIGNILLVMDKFPCCTIFITTFLWSIWFIKCKLNCKPNCFTIWFQFFPNPDIKVAKRVHNLSLLRMNKLPKLQKRVHNLSLLRMGKLFKPSLSSQVKRQTNQRLWRYLAKDFYPTW